MAAVVALQAGRWISPPASPADHSARLVQANIPILLGGDWTKEYFEGTLRDLSQVSLNNPNPASLSNSSQVPARPPDLIVWPESPAPFYTTDPAFRDAVSNIAREAQTWMLVGSLGIRNAGETPERAARLGFFSGCWPACRGPAAW